MICAKCKIDKEPAEFSFKNKEKGIYNCYCKQCQNEYSKGYYGRHKQKALERNRETRNFIVNYIREYKKSHPCIVCGESALECLDFHHIKDKDLEISTLTNYGSLSRVQAEIDKCVVLCANCHRKLHAGNLVI